jgi:hypothetical protein
LLEKDEPEGVSKVIGDPSEGSQNPARRERARWRYYLAGYPVEFALKACIAKSTERHDFPDKRRANQSHNGWTTRLFTGLSSPFPSVCTLSIVLASYR